MPCRRIRVLSITSVSPSTMRGVPVMLSTLEAASEGRAIRSTAAKNFMVKPKSSLVQLQMVVSTHATRNSSRLLGLLRH